MRFAGEATARHAVDRLFMVATMLCPQINLAEKPDCVHPKLEKYLLRKAFDLPDEPYLPDDVLFRQKEQVCRPSAILMRASCVDTVTQYPLSGS